MCRDVSNLCFSASTCFLQKLGDGCSSPNPEGSRRGRVERDVVVLSGLFVAARELLTAHIDAECPLFVRPFYMYIVFLFVCLFFLRNVIALILSLIARTPMFSTLFMMGIVRTAHYPLRRSTGRHGIRFTLAGS